MKKGKKVKKVLCTIAIVIVVLAAGCFGIWKYVDPYRGTTKNSVETMGLGEILTKDQVIEDLEFVMKTARERHPAWLEEGNEKVAKMEQTYVKELENVTGDMTVVEEWRIIGRILHELGDGHTSIYNRNSNSRYIDDFTYCFNGYSFVSVNGVSKDELCQMFLSVFQYEMEEYADAIFQANVWFSEDYLSWCGIDTSKGVEIVYEKDGQQVAVHHDFLPIEEAKGREQSNDDREWVYYEIKKDENVGIFTLGSCNYNKQYIDTVKNFFDEVHQSGVENVIVDLRWNGGGSSMVANEFIHYLDADGFYTWADEVRFRNFLWHDNKSFVKIKKKNQAFRGKVYVLTNLQSYSAAMDFAMLVGDNDLGMLVGEKSGNMPDAYGDVLKFTVPNSKLVYGVSYKRWHRIDTEKEGQPLMPDYPCDSREAMDVAMELIAKNGVD